MKVGATSAESTAPTATVGALKVEVESTVTVTLLQDPTVTNADQLMQGVDAQRLQQICATGGQQVDLLILMDCTGA